MKGKNVVVEPPKRPKGYNMSCLGAVTFHILYYLARIGTPILFFFSKFPDTFSTLRQEHLINSTVFAKKETIRHCVRVENVFNSN